MSMNLFILHHKNQVTVLIRFRKSVHDSFFYYIYHEYQKNGCLRIHLSWFLLRSYNQYLVNLTTILSHYCAIGLIGSIRDGSKSYPRSAWFENLFQRNPNLGHKIHKAMLSQLIPGVTPYNLREKVLEYRLYSLAFCNRLMWMRRWISRNFTAWLAKKVTNLGFHIFRIMGLKNSKSSID